MELEVGKSYKVKSGTEQYEWDKDGEMNELIGTSVVLKFIDNVEPKYSCLCEDGKRWYFNVEDLEEINSSFSKSDMLNGYVCELRCGEVGVWINNEYVCNGGKREYSNELRAIRAGENADIMKVSDCYGKVIWGRVEENPINTKEWKFEDCCSNRIKIKPNNINGYNSSDEPILFNMADDEEDDSSMIGLTIDQAKQIISALTEIVEFVEK